MTRLDRGGVRVRAGHAGAVSRALKKAGIAPIKTWFEDANGGTVFVYAKSSDAQAGWTALRGAGYIFHLSSIPGKEGTSLFSVFEKEQ